ncbi:MAG: response regulator transcription factor [Lachnospiraceae bacterium]|nr:response regulator transcription factor [Lachnospiraceae bacterium]
MKNKVLLIDDDKELCNLIKDCIEEEGVTLEYVCSGDLGFQKVKNLQEEYRLLILDIMLPQIDGLTILAELRKNSNIPVLMLTAKDEEVDKVVGLRMGADDYLTKPFGINELKARVYSLIRRYTVFSEQSEEKSKIEFKGLSIDLETREVYVDKKTIELTNKEFNLLAFLASHPGRAFTKKQIYAEVWEEEYSFDDNNLIAFISKLRKKIDPNESSPSYIQTIRGVGYRFSMEV